MSKYAKDSSGANLYVQTKTWFGRSHDALVRAETLAEAKRQFGWTRELHVKVKVRRATWDDVAVLDSHVGSA